MTIYDCGDVVRLSAAFADADGIATDPEVVVLRVRNAAGTHVYSFADDSILQAVSGSPVGPTVGGYYRDLQLEVSGEWFYRWECSGATIETAEESRLFVRPSRFA
jgi:hypothetical protein